jgi:hypothetical protein
VHLWLRWSSALRRNKTAAQLAAEDEVHASLVAAGRSNFWNRRQAERFRRRPTPEPGGISGHKRQLYKQIGRLKM